MKGIKYVLDATNLKFDTHLRTYNATEFELAKRRIKLLHLQKLEIKSKLKRYDTLF